MICVLNITPLLAARSDKRRVFIDRLAKVKAVGEQVPFRRAPALLCITTHTDKVGLVVDSRSIPVYDFRCSIIFKKNGSVNA